MGKKILLIAWVQAVPRRGGLAAAGEVQPVLCGTSAPEVGPFPEGGQGAHIYQQPEQPWQGRSGEKKGKNRRKGNVCTLSHQVLTINWKKIQGEMVWTAIRVGDTCVSGGGGAWVKMQALLLEIAGKQWTSFSSKISSPPWVPMLPPAAVWELTLLNQQLFSFCWIICKVVGKDLLPSSYYSFLVIRATWIALDDRSLTHCTWPCIPVRKLLLICYISKQLLLRKQRVELHLLTEVKAEWTLRLPSCLVVAASGANAHFVVVQWHGSSGKIYQH